MHGSGSSSGGMGVDILTVTKGENAAFITMCAEDSTDEIDIKNDRDGAFPHTKSAMMHKCILENRPLCRPFMHFFPRHLWAENA